jgi:protein CpxP
VTYLSKGIRFAAAAVLTLGLAAAQTTTAPGWTGRFDRIATFLNLTDAQRAQAKTIVQSSLDQAKPLVQSMRDNRTAVEQLIKTGTPNTPQFDQQAQQLANTQANLVSQLSVIHMKGLAQLYALLTPDQKQKAEQLHDLLMPGGGMMGPLGHRAPAQ